MTPIERKKKLSKVKLELERLKLADQKLIEKKRIYSDKLKIAVNKKKISLGESKEKMSKFIEEYLELRLKVGLKRMEYLKKKNELIGETTVVRLDTSYLDGIINKI